MASLNKKQYTTTHEDAKTTIISPLQELERTVMSCMLWEDQFYEDGTSTTQRIANLISQIKPEECAKIAIKARNESKLRHVPLLIVREMARLNTHKKWVSKLLYEIIQRPDESTEFLAIYWKDKKQPISKQVKKGLAGAFTKFNEYSLAKYNRDGAIRLRDVLFLVHPRPINKEQQDLWNRLVNNTLEIPDTWEVEISKNKNNPESWERLIKENKLGGLAVLRNLRNMISCGVQDKSIKEAISSIKTERILPYRFIAASKYAPKYEPQLEETLFRSLGDKERLAGRTILLVDVSGSMDAAISEKSDLQRIDAACGLAMLCRELCEDVDIYSFSTNIVQIPNRRGFALRDAISTSQSHSSTNLKEAVEYVNNNVKYDRLIIITDEQANSPTPNPKGKGYIINVASYKNGIGYGAYTHINGWSESVFDYINESEIK